MSNYLTHARDILAPLNLQIEDNQLEQFQTLYEQILAKNKRSNLTRITEPQEFLEKHLWDSLTGIQPLDSLEKGGEAKTAIDIGTGGGFPGIPIAIARPDYSITLLDSVAKKMLLLEEIIAALNLNNVKTLSGRAEAIGQDPERRESYDLVSIRAVGLASVCAEYALPFLKVGGIAILYRGQWSGEESDRLTLAARELGGEINEIRSLTTPLTQSIRHCIYLEKKEPTPAQYPRRVGVPAKKPL